MALRHWIVNRQKVKQKIRFNEGCKVQTVYLKLSMKITEFIGVESDGSFSSASPVDAILAIASSQKLPLNRDANTQRQSNRFFFFFFTFIAIHEILGSWELRELSLFNYLLQLFNVHHHRLRLVCLQLETMSLTVPIVPFESQQKVVLSMI